MTAHMTTNETERDGNWLSKLRRMNWSSKLKKNELVEQIKEE